MSAPHFSGKSHREALADFGTALLQVKNARGLTLAEMAYAMRKSDDQLARYIAGDMEMGIVAWSLAVEAWPELEDRIAETTAERSFRARQRALDLENAARRSAA